MGANNSSPPRVATMENPNGNLNTIILISDKVAGRLDGSRRNEEPTNPLSSPLETLPLKPPELPLTPALPSMAETFICKSCKTEKNKDEKGELKAKLTPPPPVPDIYEQKSKEIEKEEFEKTLELLDKTIGKPIDWTNEHKVEIQNLQTNLLQCFKDYPKEPLRCHNNAKDYQDFVFEKQYKTILKHKLGAGDCECDEK